MRACHAKEPVWDGLARPEGGLSETEAQILKWRMKFIGSQQLLTMPPGNIIWLDDERSFIV